MRAYQEMTEAEMRQAEAYARMEMADHSEPSTDDRDANWSQLKAVRAGAGRPRELQLIPAQGIKELYEHQ